MTHVNDIGRPKSCEIAARNRERCARDIAGLGYFGILPGCAALPPVPQSRSPLGFWRAVLQAVPGADFFPVLPSYVFPLVAEEEGG